MHQNDQDRAISSLRKLFWRKGSASTVQMLSRANRIRNQQLLQHTAARLNRRRFDASDQGNRAILHDEAEDSVRFENLLRSHTTIQKTSKATLQIHSVLDSVWLPRYEVGVRDREIAAAENHQAKQSAQIPDSLQSHPVTRRPLRVEGPIRQSVANLLTGSQSHPAESGNRKQLLCHSRHHCLLQSADKLAEPGKIETAESECR